MGHEVAVLREPLEVVLHVGTGRHDGCPVGSNEVEHLSDECAGEASSREALGDDRMLQFHGVVVDDLVGEESDEFPGVSSVNSSYRSRSMFFTTRTGVGLS